MQNRAFNSYPTDKMNKTDQERRTATRVPADTVKQISLEQSTPIDVNVVPSTDNYELTATLHDIHSNGMCFHLTDHILQEDDIIHIDTTLGNFSFESDAIVRWTMGNYVGVEFLDNFARNASLLAELYTEKLLRFLNESKS
jgi:hypothetical protein